MDLPQSQHSKALKILEALSQAHGHELSMDQIYAANGRCKTALVWLFKKEYVEHYMFISQKPKPGLAIMVKLTSQGREALKAKLSA